MATGRDALAHSRHAASEKGNPDAPFGIKRSLRRGPSSYGFR